MVYGILRDGYVMITDNSKDSQIVYTEMPESKSGEEYIPYWEKDRKKIIQKWKIIKDDEEEKN